MDIQHKITFQTTVFSEKAAFDMHDTFNADMFIPTANVGMHPTSGGQQYADVNDGGGRYTVSSCSSTYCCVGALEPDKVTPVACDNTAIGNVALITPASGNENTAGAL